MIKVSVIIPVFNQEELVKRAIDSIPKRDDIEIIAIDDCSTDNTFNVLMDYRDRLDNFTLLTNKENKGVGYTVNRGYDVASGEYVVLLGSDDYFTGGFNHVMEMLDGTDLVYFDLEINSGEVWCLTEKSKYGFCGSTKFIRREFLGSTRNPEVRVGEDWYFYKELMTKNPTERFSNTVVKHYNFPREDSLSYKQRKGLL